MGLGSPPGAGRARRQDPDFVATFNPPPEPDHPGQVVLQINSNVQLVDANGDPATLCAATGIGIGHGPE